MHEIGAADCSNQQACRTICPTLGLLQAYHNDY